MLFQMEWACRIKVRSPKCLILFRRILKIHFSHGKLKSALRKISWKKGAILTTLKHGALEIVYARPILLLAILIVENAKLFVTQAEAAETILAFVAVHGVFHVEAAPNAHGVFAVLTVDEIAVLIAIAAAANPYGKGAANLLHTRPAIK